MSLALILLFLFVLFIIYMIILSFNYNNRHDKLHDQYNIANLNYNAAADEIWRIMAYKYHFSENQHAAFRQLIDVDASDKAIEIFILQHSPVVIPSSDFDPSIIASPRLQLEESRKLTHGVRLQHASLLNSLVSRIFLFDKAPLV